MTDKQSPLVPRLRFIEFVDGLPWKLRSLENLAKRVTQRNTHGTDLRALTNSAEHGVVDQREYFDKDIAMKTGNYYIVEPGDFVYNPRTSSSAPVGPISRNKIGIGVMSPIYSVFRFRSDDTDFFAHFFKSSYWHGYMRRVANTGARYDRMAVTNDDVMQMPIPTPSPREQRRIADCLGSLDELIAAEGRKLEALRQHKQGLMQQLFPQPGETVPRLRFPEFAHGPDWDQATVADLVETVIPPKKLATSVYQADGRFPIIDQSRSCVCGWTDDDEAVIRIPLPVIVFGDHTCVLKLSDRPFAQGADGVKILAARRLVSTIYLYHQLTYRPVVTEEYKRHFSTLKDKIVLFPDQKSGEQQRIADCLGSLDDQIAAADRKLEALRQHKQGLMQQLFPAPEGW